MADLRPLPDPDEIDSATLAYGDAIEAYENGLTLDVFDLSPLCVCEYRKKPGDVMRCIYCGEVFKP